MLTFCIQPSTNRFANLRTTGRPDAAVRDELGEYLSLPPEYTVGDEQVLAWWKARESLYPRLSRMALDYLTIPGTPESSA